MTAPFSSDQPLIPEARSALADAVRTGRVAAAVRPGRMAAAGGAGREAAVDQAGHAATDRRSPARRRPSRRIGLLAVAGIVVSGTAVAATAPWNPPLGGRGERRASRSVAGVPAEQLATLGVLRRPATDADRSPRVLGALRFVDGRLFGGVHVEGIRLLRADDGVRGDVVLVPAKRMGPTDLPDVAGLRDAVCVIQTQRAPGRGSTSCGTIADVRRGRVRTVATGLVPDGVAEVRVTLRDGRTLVAPVRDNYYALPFRVPVVRPGGSRAAQAAALRRFRTVVGRPIVWLDAQGRPVRKGPRPGGD